MMNQDDRYIDMDERIDSFLKGLMSIDEEAAFKEEIAVNEELRQRTKERLLLLKGIQTFGREKDKMVVDSVKETKPKSHIFTLRRVIAGVSIAACLVVAILISQRYFRSEDAAMSYAMSQSTAIIDNMNVRNLRGGDTDEVEHRLEAIFKDVLADKDIKKNIGKLEELSVTATDDFVDDEDEFDKEISWFLAVAYMKDDNKAKAIEILQNTLKEYPEFKEAETLLKKLQ